MEMVNVDNIAFAQASRTCLRFGTIGGAQAVKRAIDLGCLTVVQL